MFAASLEKYLQGSDSQHGTHAVISFSFDSSSYCGRSFGDMLESLTRELLSQSPGVDLALAKIHKQILNSGLWSIESLCLLFSSAIDCFERPILCIIDGIQDCDSTSNDILQFMASLGYERTAAPFKLVLTSRLALTHTIEATLSLEHSSHMRVFVVDLDDGNVIQQERDRFLKIKVANLLPSKPLVAQTLAERLGSLNLTLLALDFMIKNQPPARSISAIEDRLDALGPNILLSQIYESHLCAHAGADTWAVLQRVMPWLIYSEQPLTIDQLAVILNLEENLDLFSKGQDRLRSADIPRMLIQTMGPLLIIEGQKVIFTHGTVREFCRQHPKFGDNLQNSVVAHAKIAVKCLQYLTSIEFQDNASFVTNSMTLHAKLTLPHSVSGAYNFLTYAAYHWPTHFRLASTSSDNDDTLFQAFESFIHSEGRLSWWRELYHYQETDSLVSRIASKICSPSLVSHQIGPLIFASFFGFASVVRKLLPDALETQRDTSSNKGYVSGGDNVGKGQSDADIDVMAAKGRDKSERREDEENGDSNQRTKTESDAREVNETSTPTHVMIVQSCLEFAVWNSHFNVVEEILNYCANSDSLKVSWCDAVHSACCVGNPDIVKRLLDKGGTSNINSCLQAASAAGHPRIVEILVETGADVNSSDCWGKVPLHYAAERGYHRVVTLLLTLGAHLITTDKDGFTALHFAARNGHQAAVRILSTRPQSDVNTEQWSIKPIHLAASHGHVAVVKVLLDQKANYTIANDVGVTPLHMAAEGGYTKTMKLLLDYGADACAVDKHGETPLHGAVRSGSLKATNLLLEHGADPDAATYLERVRPLYMAARYGHLAILQRLLECGVTVDAQLQNNKLTPFLCAAYYEHAGCLEALKEAGADIRAKTGPWTSEHNAIDGMTALHLAWGKLSVVEKFLKFSSEEDVVLARNASGHTPFFYAFGSRALDSCRLLLEHAKENKDQILNEIDYQGYLPIHIACSFDDVAFVQLLLNFGADINVLGKDTGFSPVHIAVLNGNIDHLKLLIEHHADIHIADAKGCTPMHIAANSGELNALQVLVKATASVNVVDHSSWTPLHHAASKGHYHCVKYLLDQGSNLEARDKFGSTPLLTASEENTEQSSKVIEILLKRGALPNMYDCYGWTPLHVAVSRGNQLAISLLLAQGADLEPRTKVGDTPLYQATRAGNCTIMKMLIERGADIYTFNDNHRTLMAAAMTSHNNAEEVVQVLLDVGLSMNVHERDPWGRTLLFVSAGSGRVEQTKLLLTKGVDKDAIDQIGRTALEVCTHKQIRNMLGADDEAVNISCPWILKNSIYNGMAKLFCDVCSSSDNPVNVEDDFWYRTYFLSSMRSLRPLWVKDNVTFVLTTWLLSQIVASATIIWITPMIFALHVTRRVVAAKIPSIQSPCL